MKRYALLLAFCLLGASGAFGQTKPSVEGEKIARYEQWRRFTANAGTYEIKETTINMCAIVAKNPNRPGRTNTWEFKLEGTNTLWLIPTGAQVTTNPRVKLTRLE